MKLLQDFLLSLNIPLPQAQLFVTIAGLLLFLLIAWLCGCIFRHAISPAILKIVARTHAVWDDYVFNTCVLNSLSHVVPGVVFFILLPIVFENGTADRYPYFHELFVRGTHIYITFTVVRLFCVFLTNVGRLTSEEEGYNGKHYLIGLTQFLKLAVIIIGVIAGASYGFGRSPLSLIVSLGAVATVFAFIFKDTLLGLISGIQLSANKMIKPGDWITMPKYDVNGIVEEVSLVTVKIRNFDNTISTLPPYTLISDSFRNWKGMADGGGRRVKRAIYVDINSVHPAASVDVKRWKEACLLDDSFNPTDTTNLTAFRHFIEHYLMRHPEVNTGRWLMARQLDPTPHGLPVEVYFYFTEREFVRYEHLAADCMEHFIAMMPEFGLRAYQAPTGYDFTQIN